MLKIAFSFLLAGTFLATNVDAHPDVLERSFHVQADGELVMQVDRGSIHITTGESDQVEVRVVRELKRGSDAQAQEAYRAHHVDLQEDGNTVTIRADATRRTRWFRRDPVNSLQVDYRISVPNRFHLKLRTAGGNIDVAPLNGAVEANTAGGTINLRATRGDARLETSGGDIHAGNVEGSLFARTSGGSISVDTAAGPVDARTSGGNIEIREARNTVIASTSGGNVSVQWTQQPRGNCHLHTSGGNVAVALGPGVAVDVAAHTSGGRVDSEFGGQSSRERTRFTAQINGGGPDLLLETSGGNVNIRRR